ncbi:MAG: hypothetical protein V2A72_05465 [Candidatus Omnitrophota bacterium]
MNKAAAKTIINFYGLSFIVAGLAAIFIYFRIAVGAFIFIFAGVMLLRRRAFGIYCVLFAAFIVAGVGLMLAGIAIFDILHRNYKFDLLFIGMAPIILSFLTFYLFTRPEVAEDFGLDRIAILEKVDKKELITTARILLWIVIIIGVALLACYLVAMLMSR